MHASRSTTPRLLLWPAAILSALVLSLTIATLARAEIDPNQYTCLGHIAAGEAEPGTSEQQVAYTFSCNGQITGYQIESQLPLTGFESAPLVSNLEGKPVNDTFSCNGEFPGYAIDCVGAAKAPSETIAGQFQIGSKLCAEPRVDPLLTVTYAYLEKGVITQAISGPFDLGRPHGCPPSALGGTTRLTADPVKEALRKGKSNKDAKGKGKKHSAKKKKGTPSSTKSKGSSSKK